MGAKAFEHFEWAIGSISKFEPVVSRWWFSFPLERVVLRLPDGAKLRWSFEFGAGANWKQMFEGRELGV